MDAVVQNGIDVKNLSRVPAGTSPCVQDIELRLSPVYPWLVIGFGVIFLVLGLLTASPLFKRSSVGLGLFISVISAAAVFGGNYWRQHLPLVARFTSSDLVLRRWSRNVVISWNNIEALEKKSIGFVQHGVRQRSETVFIKLKKPLPSNDPLSASFPAYKRFNEALTKGVKKTLGGYDLFINPQDEFLRSADWFVVECRKRMSLATAARS